MRHSLKNTSIALALALAAISGAPAVAHPDGVHDGGALQDARKTMPDYGGSSGSSYRPHGVGQGLRFDYGFGGDEGSKEAQLAKEKAAAHQHGPACSHGADNQPKTADAKTPGPQRAGLPDKNALPKTAATQGGNMKEVPQPPVILTGKKKEFGHFRINPEPKRVAYDTAGSKGGFSETAGLEFENEPIEYRNGSSTEYNKTKQPGLPKYAPINGPRPPVDDEFAKTILNDVKFRMEVEEIRGKYFPEPSERVKRISAD